MNVFGLDPNAALKAAGLEEISPYSSKEELDKNKIDMFDPIMNDGSQSQPGDNNNNKDEKVNKV